MDRWIVLFLLLPFSLLGEPALLISHYGAPGSQLVGTSRQTSTTTLFFLLYGIHPDSNQKIYQFLAESRTPGATVRTNRRKSEPLGSLSLENYFFRLQAGYRFLPADSSYLQQGEIRTSLGEIPSGRERASGFLQAFPDFYVPGIFSLEGYRHPGLFFCTPSQNLFLAYHPESRSGAFYGQVSTSQIFVLADLVQKNTSEGYGMGLWKSDLFSVEVDGERREYWDVPGRIGKSGQGRSKLTSEFVEVEVAGLDKGSDALRVGSLYVIPRIFDCCSPLFRGRAYTQEVYGVQPKEKPAQDNGGALGFEIRANQGQVRLVYEERRKGPASLEISIEQPIHTFTISLGAIHKKLDVKKEGYIYLSFDTPRESRGKFYLEEDGAIFFKLRHRYVYLYVSSTFKNSKSYPFASLQAYFPLELFSYGEKGILETPSRKISKE